MRIHRDDRPDTKRDAEAAFRDVYPLVLRMAQNAGLDEVEREDVAQKVGLVLVERLREYDSSKGSWRMWGAGIARRVLLEWRGGAEEERGRTDRNRSIQQVPAPALTPEQSTRAREALAILRAAVRRRHREVFELDALGWTAAEIGERLGLPITTVSWKIKEARKDLRRVLASMGEDRDEVMRVRGVPGAIVAAGGAASSTSRTRSALRIGAIPALALGLVLVVVRATSDGSAGDSARDASTVAPLSIAGGESAAPMQTKTAAGPATITIGSLHEPRGTGADSEKTPPLDSAGRAGAPAGSGDGAGNGVRRMRKMIVLKELARRGIEHRTSAQPGTEPAMLTEPPSKVPCPPVCGRE